MYQSPHLAPIPSQHQPGVLAESMQVARRKGQHPDRAVGEAASLGPEARL